MKKNRIVSITVALSITLGVAFSEYLSSFALPLPINLVITLVVSASIHEVLFWLLEKMIEHFEPLLKLYWGKEYIKGYWSYTYYVCNEKRYGVWCIDQDIDSITIKGFGLTVDGVRRSDVQSLTSLIPHGNDFEIVNMRRDISAEGNMSDTFYYSKTSLHLQQRNTFMNLFNYPLYMDGVTYIYGGVFSGSVHQRLKFQKHRDARNEHDIEELVKNMIKNAQGGDYVC